MVTLQILLLFAILSQALAEFKCYSQEFTAIEDITFDEKNSEPCETGLCLMLYTKEKDSQGNTTASIDYGCDEDNFCKLPALGWNGDEFMNLTMMIYCCSSSLCNKVTPPTRPTRVPPPVTQPKAGNLYLPYNVLILAVVMLCRNV